jgi:predicted RNA-binding Zn-ribbon protein involved in translation (DUF1610 family)
MDKETIKPLEDLLDNVRNIDGFPISIDEDIIKLSDLPYYTACPNPYLKDYIENTERKSKLKEYFKFPFVSDVQEGKGGSVYNAHSYHTKVPYKAIKKFIEHYTTSGDIIFDGFCWSGMTGVAAKMANRDAILIDLSPYATNTAYYYSKSEIFETFKKDFKKIIENVKDECGWMYKTKHNRKGIDGSEILGIIDNVIWSDVYYCPDCGKDLIFWDIAVDVKEKKFRKQYNCNSCGIELAKIELKQKIEKFYDKEINREIKILKSVPVSIKYSVGTKRYEKIPDENDLKILDEIRLKEIPYWFPVDKMMFKGENWGDTWRKGVHFGVTNTHHFYTKRNLWILSCLYENITRIKNKSGLIFLFTSVIERSTLLNRFRFKGTGGLSGTLYIPSIRFERNPILLTANKFKQISSSYNSINKNSSKIYTSTQSCTDLSNIPKNCIDYIFVDPPFGSNLMYSELSFISESWLKIFTNINAEAIISKAQKKEIFEYTNLMVKSFKQMFEILKPNHWMTVVFHNSQASVWNGIQEAITRAGFIIAQVSVLDKKQGSFKQVVYSGTVKNDLIINAYKPTEQFSNKLLRNAGEDMELEFVLEHLKHLPIKPNIERTENMIFSKLLAHYVENGFKIKYNASTFYNLLSENLIEIDGYWFIDNQVKDYNEWKSGLNLDQLKEIKDGQKSLFISDEKSAIAWFYFFLDVPKDYNTIFTAYQKVLMKSKDEIPEPRALLDNNFIFEGDKYRRPLNKQEKQKLNQNREKELNKEFNLLLTRAKEQKGKIKTIRLEVLLYGFTKLYKEEKYEEILIIANKLYNTTLESFGEIMDFVDIAKLKTDG